MSDRGPGRELERLKSHLAEAADPRARTELLLMLGDAACYIDTGQALDYYRQALEGARACGLVEMESRALSEIAFKLLEAGRTAEGLDQGRTWLSRFAGADPEAQVPDQEVLARLCRERERQAAGTADPNARSRYLLQLGEALCYSDPARAESYFRRAAESAQADGLPEFRTMALCSLAFLLLHAGLLDQAEALAQEALATARQKGLPKREASAHNTIAMVLQHRGEPVSAIPHFEACLRIAREIGWEGGISTALSNLAVIHSASGNPAKAMALYREALALEEKRSDWTAAAVSYSNLASCELQVGEWDRALEHDYRALTMAEQHDLKWLMASSLHTIGLVYADRGRDQRALELLRQALAIAQAAGFRGLESEIQGSMGLLHLEAGDHTTTELCLAEAERLAELSQASAAAAKALVFRSEFLFRLGRLEAAATGAATAHRTAVESGLSEEAGHALRIRARALAALTRDDEARQAFEASLAVLSGAGARADGRPVTAHESAMTHLDYARFLLQRSDRPAAHEHARQAYDTFRALSVLHRAEEAVRLIRSAQSSPPGTDSPHLALLQRLSAIATWPAAFSELTTASVRLLAEGLHFGRGALFVYGRQPCAVGPIDLPTLLRLPRDGQYLLGPSSVRIPLLLRNREVGFLFLDDGEAVTDRPGRPFWEIAGQMLSLMVEKVQARAGTFEDATGRVRLAGSVASAQPAPANLRFGTIFAACPAMNSLLDCVEQVAGTRATVLIRGESGTGKELVARALHGLSPRASRQFVVVNCAALPETLIEAELFGIESGVATGVSPRIGRLRQADGGTVFLDEIGELSPGAQAKLLRVIQERVVESLGGRAVAVDIRVIAATSLDLESRFAAGGFREDLYHRLNVLALLLPPLRDRREEIPGLVEYFIQKYGEEFMRPVRAVTASAMDALLAYAWPGNVRELENAMERAVLTCREAAIRNEDLPANIGRAAALARPPKLEKPGNSGRADEAEAVRRALENSGGQVAAAARALGISRMQLYRLIRRHGLRPGSSA